MLLIAGLLLESRELDLIIIPPAGATATVLFYEVVSARPLQKNVYTSLHYHLLRVKHEDGIGAAHHVIAIATSDNSF